jgi:Holliday junction resolvase RusA-like endonuclease
VFFFIVLGDPISKARPRSNSFGRTYTPHRTRNAERAVREAAVQAFPFSEPFGAPVGVRLVFHCKTRRRVDWDNLAKLATAAMNGVV